MKTENTSKWYENRRNELLALLKEASALDVPEKYADELHQTTRKCQEDAFEIALVGEFQGGKTTTFNALCDGRDISPRGLGGGGIKTSAAVISAQNIAGNETKDGLAEWAEVSFKTPGAIALGLSTILRRPLMGSDAFRKFNAQLSDEKFAEAIATDDGFPGLVDLDNDECRAALTDAANALWGKWRENRASLSDDELDELRIATLQLRFYGNAEYCDMASRTVLPIDKFQKLIAFPKDWMIRWMNGPDSEFSLDEVAFVFVQSVLVRIHAENLRRLGCRITDCPGLFANAYDTSVARRTILNADAVWYLINGAKQIGDKDLRIIRDIASMGMLGKIQATSNLRGGAHEHLINNILPVTQSILKNAGHDVAVFPYNARLAFLAMQGQLLLCHPEKFSELDKANMAVDAKKFAGPDPATMWVKMIQKKMSLETELESLEGIEGLDAESVAIVRRESMLDGILTRLEDEIIPQKARSILVNRGSDRASKALVAYEGVLKATEDAAEATEAEWRAKVEDARKQLAEFVDRAKTIINRSAFSESKDDLVRLMATDIVDNALDDEFATTLATDVSAILRITARNFYWTRAAMEQDVVQRLGPVIAEDFQESFQRATEKWKKEADSNSLSRLHRSLENVCADIHDLWVDRKMDASGILKGFVTPNVTADDVLDVCADFSNAILSKTGIGTLAEKGRRGFFTVLWEYIWPEMLIFLGAIICFPLTVAAVVGKQIYDMMKSPEQREQAELEKIQREIGKIVGKVKPEIEKALSDSSFRNGIAEQIGVPLSDSVLKIESNLRKRLDDLKIDFEKERVSEPEKMFDQSAEERRRIATENKAIRTKTIEPLRKRIDAFKDAVVADLSASA